MFTAARIASASAATTSPLGTAPPPVCGVGPRDLSIGSTGNVGTGLGVGVRGGATVRSGVGIGFGVRENDGTGVDERAVGAADAVSSGGAVAGGASVGPAAVEGDALGDGSSVGNANPSSLDRLSSSRTETTTITAAMTSASQGRIRSTQPRGSGNYIIVILSGASRRPKESVPTIERETGIEPA